ncbi:hypothetical protein BGZ74_004204 [Mortierella antarctica]|nr:hypothetical protein BGZ74_004204 [Mortierella antarctica]
MSAVAALAVACLMATPVQGDNADCKTKCTDEGIPQMQACIATDKTFSECWPDAEKRGKKCMEDCIGVQTVPRTLLSDLVVLAVSCLMAAADPDSPTTFCDACKVSHRQTVGDRNARGSSKRANDCIEGAEDARKECQEVCPE